MADFIQATAGLYWRIQNELFAVRSPGTGGLIALSLSAIVPA